MGYPDIFRLFDENDCATEREVGAIITRTHFAVTNSYQEVGSACNFEGLPDAKVETNLIVNYNETQLLFKVNNSITDMMYIPFILLEAGEMDLDEILMQDEPNITVQVFVYIIHSERIVG